MKFETETIDNLFLELSQFTSARTKRERLLEDYILSLSAALTTALNGLETGECPGSAVLVGWRDRIDAAREHVLGGGR